MKATAVAPANIAFIKYWGKSDDVLRIPLNDSISMNLSGAQTTTTVEFSPVYTKDSIMLLGGSFSEKETDRVVDSLSRIRESVGVGGFVRVVTQNTFPKGAGAAASASGFAALTVAGFAAAGKSMTEKEQTIFARLGSGSACRSIPDGFVQWQKGNSNDNSYAYSLYPHDYWDLRDILVIVDAGMKKVSTTEGHSGVTTSPLLDARLRQIPDKIARVSHALAHKNFQELGEAIEEESESMHSVMETQIPPLYYRTGATHVIMEAVVAWRNRGIPAYFTIDAGPNVHIICEAKDEDKVVQQVKQLGIGVDIIVNTPAPGAHIVDRHLF